MDTCSVGSINGKCNVLTLKAYEDLNAEDKDDEEPQKKKKKGESEPSGAAAPTETPVSFTSIHIFG